MAANTMLQSDDPKYAKWIVAQQYEWMELFLSKARDYGENEHTDLGLAGQYADMSRKFRKLRRALWEGKQLAGEQPPEILMDLIGHCWITLYEIAKLAAENEIDGVDNCD